jgi:Rps23 Pro-64 3,4-dihydroxylase Tpa1-like proline 4-hydroxylase
MNSLYSEAFATRLRELADTHGQTYASAQPYPHAVMDDFLPAEVLDGVLEKYPSPQELKWIKFNDAKQKKLASNAIEKLDEGTRNVLYFLNSSLILGFLERLTGIPGLIPDPYFVGGGLHQIERGGKLDIHADFNKLEKFNLDRRLNLIIYVNKNWKEEYGGHFELWDRDMKACVKKVLPVFNRCVVFSTTDTSFHGHPIPLSCPEGVTRKSMALYYYSNGRPEQERSQSHSTLFRARPGDQNGISDKVKEGVRLVTPPIILETVRRWRGGQH